MTLRRRSNPNASRLQSMTPPHEPIPTSGQWRRPWAEVLAALAAIVCFLNVLPNEFCYDDQAIVAGSAKVNEPGGWGEIWTTDHWSDAKEDGPNRDLLYRPVSLSTHRLLRIGFGSGPLPHHLGNVFLHVLLCVLVVRLCRHVGGSGRSAAVAGVLFAVLPIHTEAVAPIVGRSDLLATLGILAAVLAHRRSLGAGGSAAIARWRFFAAMAAFVAVGSKESGVAVIVLVPLFDLLWSRAAGNDDDGAPPRFRTIRRTLYLVVPLVLYLALRYHALGGAFHQSPPLSKTLNVLVEAPLWQRGLGAVQLWGMYWSKTVWPSVLSIKYTINSLRLATGLSDPHVLIGAAVVLMLAATCVTTWRRGGRQVTVLAVALIVSYLPTSNVLVLLRVFIAERTWYLPSVWLVLIIALIVAPRMRRKRTWVVFGVVAVAMVGRCWVRSGEWRNNRVLYVAAVTDQPQGAGALQLLGHWLVERGGLINGIGFLNRSVEIDPGFTDAHRSLGRAHLRAGNRPAALHHLQIADMQVPGHAPTVTALARVSRELAIRDAELTRLENLAREDPPNIDNLMALVRKLRDLGQTEEALARLTKYDANFHDSATWHAEFAVTLVFLNERDRAIQRYRRSLDIDSDQPQQAVELASLLRERGAEDDLDQAWRWSLRAFALAPHLPSVLLCRAELLTLRGDRAAGGEAFRAAIRALPKGSAVRRVYRERATALGFRLE